MNEAQLTRTITFKGTSEGLDKLAADLNKVAAATENVTVVTEKAGRVRSVEDAYRRQTLKLDEAARAQNAIARETRLADAALREQIINQDQHAQRIDLINQRYNTASQATQKFTQQTGLARHELINLGRQAQDVGVSLVSGQSPFMVLAQQGAQIADIFISSGKSVGEFFRQATNWALAFAKTPVGIVSGIAAIGAAAVYAAYLLTKSSTTVEEALEEQNRLLKENKTAIEDVIAARIKLQSQDLTQFQMMRNEIDLREKAIKAAKEQAEIGRRVGTGEEGFLPTGPTAGNANAGYASIKAAVDALNASIKSGQPNLVEYNNELGKIGLAHPELGKTLEWMQKQGAEAAKLEEAWKKIAAAKQSAALIELSNQQAAQAAEAAERQARAILELADAYPGMSFEVAKQLDALEGQLQVAQARTGLEKINAEYLNTQAQLLLQGKTYEEAIAIAEAQRAVALAQVNTQASIQLRTLQEEGELLRASSQEERERIRARQEYQQLIDKGVDPAMAGAIASQMQENARATRDAAGAARDWSGATQDAADNTKSWSVQMDEANDAINSVSSSMAANAAAARQASRALAEYEMWYEKIGFAVQTRFGNAQFWENQGRISQFDPAGYTSTSSFASQMYNALVAQYGEGGFDPTTGAPNAQGLQYAYGGQFSGGTPTTGGLLGIGLTSTRLVPGAPGGFPGDETYFDPQRAALIQRGIELMPQDQQLGAYQQFLELAKAAPGGIEQAELVKQLMDKIEQLTRATDDNTDATRNMTDVLSPFYSSDPRRTHLGFRAFAGGGIMSSIGELPMMSSSMHSAGGITNTAHAAVFGEGSEPEAYVPVPSGRIPVTINAPANSNQRPINVRITVMGNADSATVAGLKQTAFQKAQALRRMSG